MSRGISEAMQLACEHYILSEWKWGTPLGGPVSIMCRGFGEGQCWTWPVGTPFEWVCRALRPTVGKLPKTALHVGHRGGTTVLWSSEAKSPRKWMDQRGVHGWSFGSSVAALHMH